MKQELKPTMIIIATLVFFACIILDANKTYRTVNIHKHKLVVNTNNVPINERNLLKFIKEMNIKHPEVVLAQCKLESNFFTSKVFRENNNLLGMKHPRQRPTTSKGLKGNYANFLNWKECIIDYALWQTKCFRGQYTQDEYLQKLSRIYAEDSKYFFKVKKLIK